MNSSVIKRFTQSLLRVKKIVTAVSLLLFSFLLMLLILVFILTGTDRGFRFLLDSAQDFSSERFQYSKVTGNLVSKFELTDFEYHDPSVKLNIRQFHFDWQAEDLFSGIISINNIEAADITFTQLATAKEDDEENSLASESSIQLPEISLPVKLILKQAQLTDIHFILAPDSKAQHIEKIILSADMFNNRLNLHQLLLTMPLPSAQEQTHPQSQAAAVQSTIHGYAELINNYPLTLQSTIGFTLPGQTELTISGAIKGDLSQLHINQQTSGLFDSAIKAQANHLLKEIDWQTDIHISRLPVGLLVPENNQIMSDKVISAQLSASGDLTQANTLIKAHLSATAPLKTSLADSFSEDNSLAVDAVLSWRDAIKWQVSLHTNKLNPGLFLQEWPGSLNIQLHTDGQLSDAQFMTNIQLNQLNGQLREKPLDGSGQFHIDNNTLSIRQFALASGNARIKANGKLGNSGEDVLLNWSLDIGQLADLLPGAQGSINGQGSAEGKLQQPVINGQLKLNDISYQTSRLSQVDLQLSLNSNPLKDSNIEINAHSLSFDSQEIKQFKLNLKGPLEKHQLTITAQHERANLALTANGGFDIDQLNWAGQIRQLLIDDKELGHWQQQTPAELFAAADKVSLSPLCLRDVSNKSPTEQHATLCTFINWLQVDQAIADQSSQKSHAGINLSKLSFERLKPYLPEEISELTGELDVQADVDLGPQLLAQIKAEIKPGELIFQPLTQQPVKLTHRNGLLTANYNNHQLQAQWNIEIGPHRIDGKINIPRKAIEKEPLTAPIKGNINIDIKDLNLLSIMLPQTSDVSGYLSAQLQLDGVLGSPKVTGHADLTADYLSIRDAGIRIEDISINLQDKNNGQALALLGRLRSGDGQLELNGLISLDAARGWPVDAALKGNNFLAVNTPDLYAVISPDIQFRQEQGLMHFKGRILVPEATISPATIPEGSISTSSDVEVLGIEKPAPANLDINITLAVGTVKQSNGVKLDAFGLKTGLAGELTVDQRPRQLMTAHGELHLKDGSFRAYGQDLSIDSGSIFYAGGYIDNPGIKLTASRKVADTKVGIRVSGSARKPKVDTFSDDAGLETKDIISMMLTGQKVDDLDQAKIYAGTEISEGLSVGVNAGMGDEGSEFVTRYKLTDKIQLEGTSSAAKSGGNIIYTFEME